MSNLAIVLLSGGLDSATTLAIARDEGFEPCALSFSYGQRHAIELEAARAVARRQGAVRHMVMTIDLGAFGGSALTSDLPVPRPARREEIGREIPVTYVPARNTIFLSFALGWAEVLGSSHIFIGVNALDYSGYPDCRPEFVDAFERLANLATRSAVEGCRVEIHAPLLHLTKAEVILRGLALGVDYGLTRSCYDPDGNGIACGTCDACLLRIGGFETNGIPDPAPYQKRPST